MKSKKSNRATHSQVASLSKEVKSTPSWVPGPLSPQEIESLRQDAKQASLESKAYFEKMSPQTKKK